MLTFHFVRAPRPVLLVHGGAGRFDPNTPRAKHRRAFLDTLAARIWSGMKEGMSAREAVQEAIEALEASGLFNAGAGAHRQRDGVARLSAAVMDGARGKFSGVQLVTHLRHPSRLALALQSRDESVLGPFGAQLLAREMGLAPEYTPSDEASSDRAPNTESGGTVGAVALDVEGRLAAATSTGGGRGNGTERMSDSATVAGTYASPWAAISCTGIGEQIVDDGVAVRLETRVRDGLSLKAAADRGIREAQQGNRSYGWIALDCRGDGCCYATDALYWAIGADVAL